jgi:hypothetical protein
VYTRLGPHRHSGATFVHGSEREQHAARLFRVRVGTALTHSVG